MSQRHHTTKAISEATATTESAAMTKSGATSELAATTDSAETNDSGTSSLSSSEDFEMTGTGSIGTIPPLTSQYVPVSPAAILSTISEEIFPGSKRESNYSVLDAKLEEVIIGVAATSLKDSPSKKRNFEDYSADEVFVNDIEPDDQDSRQDNRNPKPTDAITSVEIHRQPERDTTREDCSSSVANEADGPSVIGTLNDIENQLDGIRFQFEKPLQTEPGISAITQFKTSADEAVVKGASNVASNTESTVMPNVGEILLKSPPGPSESPQPIAKMPSTAVASSENEGKAKVRRLGQFVPPVLAELQINNSITVEDKLSTKVESESSSESDSCEITSRDGIERNSSVKSLNKYKYTPAKNYQPKVASPLASPDIPMSPVGAKFKMPLESEMWLKKSQSLKSGSGCSLEKSAMGDQQHRPKTWKHIVSKRILGNPSIDLRGAWLDTEKAMAKVDRLRSDSSDGKSLNQNQRTVSWSVGAPSAIEKPVVESNCNELVCAERSVRGDSVEGSSLENVIRQHSVDFKSRMEKSASGGYFDKYLCENQQQHSSETTSKEDGAKRHSTGFKSTTEKPSVGGDCNNQAGVEGKPVPHPVKAVAESSRVRKISFDSIVKIRDHLRDSFVSISPLKTQTLPTGDKVSVNPDNSERKLKSDDNVQQQQKPQETETVTEEVPYQPRYRKISTGSMQASSSASNLSRCRKISTGSTNVNTNSGSGQGKSNECNSTQTVDKNFRKFSRDERRAYVPQILEKRYRKMSHDERDAFVSQVLEKRYRKISRDEPSELVRQSSTQALRPASVHLFSDDSSPSGSSPSEESHMALSSLDGITSSAAGEDPRNGSAKSLRRSDSHNLQQTGAKIPWISVQEAREFFKMLDRQSSNEKDHSLPQSAPNDKNIVLKPANANAFAESKSAELKPDLLKSLKAIPSLHSKPGVNSSRRRRLSQ